jgi:hypothetical protein
MLVLHVLQRALPVTGYSHPIASSMLAAVFPLYFQRAVSSGS